MQNSKEKEVVDDLDLFSLVKKGLKVFNKYKKFIISIYFLGLLAGGIYYILKPKTYQSTLIASSNVLKGSHFIIIMEGLQRHLLEGNYDEAAKALNTNAEFARKIKKLEVFSVRNFSKKQLSDKITEEDTRETIINDYIIEAYVSDNSIWPELQKGLLYYLDNNEFSILKNNEKKEGLRRVAGKINDQLGRIDSLAISITKIYSGESKNSSSSNVYLTDPSSVYNNIIELYKTVIETEIELREPTIYIVQGFSPFKKQYSPKLFPTVLISIVLSTILVMGFIVYKENQE